MVCGWRSHSPTFTIHKPFHFYHLQLSGMAREFVDREQSRDENPNPFMHVGVLHSDWCPPAENPQGDSPASVPPTHPTNGASRSLRSERHADTKSCTRWNGFGLCAGMRNQLKNQADESAPYSTLQLLDVPEDRWPDEKCALGRPRERSRQRTW